MRDARSRFDIVAATLLSAVTAGALHALLAMPLPAAPAASPELPPIAPVDTATTAAIAEDDLAVTARQKKKKHKTSGEAQAQALALAALAADAPRPPQRRDIMLTKADVMPVVTAGARALEACGERHGVDGVIKMRWNVSKNGDPRDVEVADSHAGTPVGACVAGVVRSWRFRQHAVQTPTISISLRL